MEPLALITHLASATSVVLLSILFNKRIIALYYSVEKRYPNFFLGNVNVINILVFGGIYIVAPNSIANFIIYAIDKSVYLQTHTGSAFYYVSSFVVSSFLLKIFSLKRVKNA